MHYNHIIIDKVNFLILQFIHMFQLQHKKTMKWHTIKSTLDCYDLLPLLNRNETVNQIAIHTRNNQVLSIGSLNDNMKSHLMQKVWQSP